jgi:hypothetical protein
MNRHLYVILVSGLAALGGFIDYAATIRPW